MNPEQCLSVWIRPAAALRSHVPVTTESQAVDKLPPHSTCRLVRAASRERISTETPRLPLTGVHSCAPIAASQIAQRTAKSDHAIYHPTPRSRRSAPHCRKLANRGLVFHVCLPNESRCNHLRSCLEPRNTAHLACPSVECGVPGRIPRVKVKGGRGSEFALSVVISKRSEKDGSAVCSSPSGC
jgi:hypothetical protein